MKEYLVIITLFVITSCVGEENDKMNTGVFADKSDYLRIIPGSDDTLNALDVQRGKVLVNYSDCHTCHTVDQRSKGPAFADIARRYPVNEGYINLLARRIISGGSGAWGFPVMTPHPDLTQADARLMVKYVLSLAPRPRK